MSLSSGIDLRCSGLLDDPLTIEKLQLASREYSRQISSPLVNSHQLFLHRHVTVVDVLPSDDNIGQQVLLPIGSIAFHVLPVSTVQRMFQLAIPETNH